MSPTKHWSWTRLGRPSHTRAYAEALAVADLPTFHAHTETIVSVVEQTWRRHGGEDGVARVLAQRLDSDTGDPVLAARTATALAQAWQTLAVAR